MVPVSGCTYRRCTAMCAAASFLLRAERLLDEAGSEPSLCGDLLFQLLVVDRIMD